MRTLRVPAHGLIAVLLALSLLCPGPAPGHGTPIPRHEAIDGYALTPPREGSVEFARALERNVNYLLTVEQRARLDRIARHFRNAHAIESGEVAGYTGLDAAYNRALAEQLLADLVENHPDMVEILYRDRHRPHEDLHVPAPQPPMAGALLMKVVVKDGDDSINFRTRTVNMAYSGDAVPFDLTIHPDGTTYYLIELTSIPPGTSHLMAAFIKDGEVEPNWWEGFSVSSEPGGLFGFEVVDEAGRRTPALGRLTEVDTGRLWSIPGHVDIDSIMDDITIYDFFTPEAGYNHGIPGERGGPYWVIDEPVEMMLPPGEWEITINRGVEYEPLRERFTIEPEQWTRRQFKLARWIDMPARGWYSGDDHVHAKLTNHEDAAKIMAYAQAVDIRVANILQMGDEKRIQYQQRGFGPEFRVHDDGYYLVPGQEDPRSVFGHFIGLNITRPTRDLSEYHLHDVLYRKIREQGGLFGHTHVGEGYLGIKEGMTITVPLELHDFNSIMQHTLGTELYYEHLNLGFKLTASAGSDMPYGGAIGNVRIFAHTGNTAELVPEEWFDALEAGRTFVTSGPMLDLAVEGAMPGEEVRVLEDRPLTVRAAAMGQPGVTAPRELNVVVNGRVHSRFTSDDPLQGTIEKALEIDSGYGFWLALHAVGHDGSEAHTTPVYVRREGFRHWDFENAEALLQRRMEKIGEVIEMIETMTRNTELNNLNPMDMSSRWVAWTADDIMIRVERARGVYEQLFEVLAEEARLRGHDRQD